MNIPDVNDFRELQNMSGDRRGKNNSFQIPDLSEFFPNLTPTSGLPTFSNEPGKLLTGKPLTGDPKGKLTPLNINKLEQIAIQADELGYNLSDEDFARRFPDLVKARDYNIESSRLNIAGERDPFIYNALSEAGLGDIDFGTGVHNIERNMGVKIGSKESRDRTYFQRLLADNPQRAFGLNSKDVARVALANTQGINMNAMGQSEGRLQQALSNASSDAASQAALVGAIGSIGAAGIKAYGGSHVSPTLSPNYYAPSVPAGYNSGASFGYGDPYSGNYYDASGNYVGNTITGGG